MATVPPFGADFRWFEDMNSGVFIDKLVYENPFN